MTNAYSRLGVFALLSVASLGFAAPAAAQYDTQTIQCVATQLDCGGWYQFYLGNGPYGSIWGGSQTAGIGSTGVTTTNYGAWAGSYQQGAGNTDVGVGALQSAGAGMSNDTTSIGYSSGSWVTPDFGSQFAEGNVFYGNDLGVNMVGSYNNVLGVNSGENVNGFAPTMATDNNNIIGYGTGYNINGSNNNYLGYGSGNSQTGDNNSLYDSGGNGVSGSNNFYMGGSGRPTGDNNFGYGTGWYGQSGNNSFSLGGAFFGNNNLSLSNATGQGSSGNDNVYTQSGWMIGNYNAQFGTAGGLTGSYNFFFGDVGESVWYLSTANTMIGAQANDNGSFNTTAGDGTNHVNGNSNVGLGSGALWSENGNYNVGVGPGASEGGFMSGINNNTGIGYLAGTVSQFNNSIAIGYAAGNGNWGGSTVAGTDNVNAGARGGDGGNTSYTVNIGPDGIGTNGNYSVAIGFATNWMQDHNVNVGTWSSMWNYSNQTLIGNSDQLLAANSVVVGYQSAVQAINGVAVGYSSTANGPNGVALGYETKSTTSNSVSLAPGAQGWDSYIAPTSSATIDGITFGGFAGSNPFGNFNLSDNVWNDLQMVNVAAGQINSTSTDLVNGSELYAIMLDLLQPGVLQSGGGGGGGGGTSYGVANSAVSLNNTQIAALDTTGNTSVTTAAPSLTSTSGFISGSGNLGSRAETGDLTSYTQFTGWNTDQQ